MDEPFEKIQVATLTRAIDFVKFAEAKHAVLLTLSSAWTLGITTLLTTHIHRPFTELCLQLSRAAFVAALLNSTWSFLPKRKLEIFHREPPTTKNLLFFGHIAMLSLKEFREQVGERYAGEDEEARRKDFFNDLADQIAVNSKIADRKFILFNRSAAILMAGVVILALPTALKFLGWFGGLARTVQ